MFKCQDPLAILKMVSVCFAVSKGKARSLIRFQVELKGIRPRKLISLLNMLLFLSVATPDPVMPAVFEGITLGLVSISWETQLPEQWRSRRGFSRNRVWRCAA
jgi:hypothetical protein